MRPGVDVRGVAFEGGAVTGLRLFQFALLKEEVAKLGMVMRLVEVMNLGLKLLDAAAVERPRQFKAARRRGCRAIDCEIIEERREAKADEDEESPRSEEHTSELQSLR